MTLGATLRRACRLPPHVLARKVAGRLQRRFDDWRARRRDQYISTYRPLSAGYEEELPCYFRLPDLALLRRDAELILTLAERFCEHRFDLLGSGWVRVAHGMECRGVEGFHYSAGTTVQADPEGNWLAGRVNAANVPEARRIWRFVDSGYVPIDWQLDFKSGWRWSEAVWYRDIRYGDRPGADVKVPWELARMQHLPTLALAHALTAGPQADRYAREFRNQVLDFLAANPPRFGVNWHCTMDVAIRVCNWLVAYDLFRADRAVFDRAFCSLFHRAVHEHALHIAHNLEWNAELRGNHYLANLVGLIFAAGYLPRSPQTDTWLALGVRELINETQLQFDEDGANFEVSCSYHRLSAEMVAYATALVLGLPTDKQQALGEYDHRRFLSPPALPPAPLPLYPVPGGDRVSPFPPWYFERLGRMARFTAHITRPDGRVPQFGDNDNGRFLKLQPVYRPDLSEDGLDHAGLVAAIAGLFDCAPAGAEPNLSWWEGQVLRDVAKISGIVMAGISTANVAICGGVELCSYPRFGLFIYRTPRIYLAVRCGPVGQNGHGGHAHNDQLSIELAVDGLPLVIDPGTYLYTPLPTWRNRFRATAMHNTLAFPGREQNPWPDGPDGLFRLADRARAVVLCCEPGRFVGEHYGFGLPCRRTLHIDRACVRGIDECACDGPREVWFHLAPGVVAERDGAAVRLTAGQVCVRLEGGTGRWEIEESACSPGYGVRRPCAALRLCSTARRIEWRFLLVGRR